LTPTRRFVFAAIGTAFLLCAIGAFVYITLVTNANQDIQTWKNDRLEGQRRYVDGDYVQAEAAYEKALSSLTLHPHARAQLAVTLCEQARVENLLHKYDKAEQLSGRARDLYLQLLDAKSISEVVSAPANLSTVQMNTFEQLIRSLSALARACDGQGKKGEAKEAYVSLVPLYQKWWNYQKDQPLFVIGRQMVEDMLALAKIYDASGDRGKERHLVSYLVAISDSPCLSARLKERVDALQKELSQPAAGGEKE